MRLRTQLNLIILPLVIIPLTWIGWLVFNQLLEEITNGSNHHKTIGALFFLDIDNFKNVNDSLGHEVGDELLTAFSDCLKTVLREIFHDLSCDRIQGRLCSKPLDNTELLAFVRKQNE